MKSSITAADIGTTRHCRKTISGRIGRYVEWWRVEWQRCETLQPSRRGLPLWLQAALNSYRKDFVPSFPSWWRTESLCEKFPVQQNSDQPLAVSSFKPLFLLFRQVPVERKVLKDSGPQFFSCIHSTALQKVWISCPELCNSRIHKWRHQIIIVWKIGFYSDAEAFKKNHLCKPSALWSLDIELTLYCLQFLP